jgi:hypothetical protein
MPQFLTDPVHWRLRAREARRLAQQLDDPEARAAKLKMADKYDRRVKAMSEKGGAAAAVAAMTTQSGHRVLATIGNFSSASLLGGAASSLLRG